MPCTFYDGLGIFNCRSNYQRRHFHTGAASILLIKILNTPIATLLESVAW